MVAAVENIDVVVLVDPDAADLLEGPAGRQFRPVLHRFVCVRAVANGSHARAPLFIAGWQACHEVKGSASQVWLRYRPGAVPTAGKFFARKFPTSYDAVLSFSTEGVRRWRE